MDNVNIEVDGKAISTQDYLKLIVNNSMDTFKELTHWKEDDFEKYKLLLENLKELNGAKDVKTTDKGAALEELVKFIIKKTFFYKVHGNVKTGTNEIDQVVCLSNEGKQALEQFSISRKLIPIYEDLFLCECKNYKSSLGVTWIGKFYGLLNSCDCNFGILFTVNGLTGDEETWSNSFGLIRIFNLIQKHKFQNDNFNIIEFNLDDYEKIAHGEKFFDLVDAKIKAMKLATTYEQLLEDNIHEKQREVKELIRSISIE
ncbi:hypothetical protein KCL46_001485 [Clostridium perfringens]|nr:hypothetical protein [Clostridium perfringens]